MALDYDKILLHVGETGRWNLINHLLIWTPLVIGGMAVLVYSFTGLEPSEFRCLIPECDSDNPSPAFSDVPAAVFPEDPDEDDGELDYCSYYRPLINATADTCDSASSFDVGGASLECATEDGNFVYEPFEMDNSVVTEFDLVCDRQYQVALVGSIYMCGLLAGSFVMGVLADKIGRMPTLMVTTTLCVGAGFGGAFVDSYAWYCVTRFFTGMGAQGCVLMGFLLAVEISGDRTKTIAGINVEVAFAIGESIVSVIGIRVKDWRDFQMWTSAPLLIVLLVYFVVPESPRWLLKMGREDEFVKVVQRAAKVNKVTIPPELLEKSGGDKKAAAEEEEEDGPKKEPLGMSALFSTPAMVKITLVMWLNWIITTLGYYGISLGIGDIGSDVFINFLLVSLVEIPSYAFATLTIDHLGRKTLYIFCTLLTGVGCLSAAFLEDGNTAKTVLSLIGKFGAAAGFAIIYLYTGELHPTEIRSTAVGLCSTFARIGGVAAPQIALYFPTFTFDAFPMLFMGACALAGGALAMLLPETLGSPLIESIEDVDRLWDNPKPFFSWWSTEQVERSLERQRIRAAGNATKEEEEEEEKA